MISYRLICCLDHRFEGWFRNSATFDEQSLAGELTCPMCGDTGIRKDIMAPALARSGSLGEQPTAPMDTDSSTPAPAAAPDKADVSEAPVTAAPVAAKPMQLADFKKMAAFVAMARKVHTYVEKNFDNVGGELPEEARKIHYGETETRNIYGQASLEEAEELREEGIDLHALPALPKFDG